MKKASRKPKVKRDIPVSQRELANYLGISPSMFHMAESSHYLSHNLSSRNSLKLLGLTLAQLEVQKTRQAGPSCQLVQDSVDKNIAKAIGDLEYEALRLERKAREDQQKLDDMISREREDRDWLNTVDHLLANIPDTKDKDKDRGWLESQQETVSARLKKNSRLAQVKLQLQMEVDKARARACREAVEELAGTGITVSK